MSLLLSSTSVFIAVPSLRATRGFRQTRRSPRCFDGLSLLWSVPTYLVHRQGCPHGNGSLGGTKPRFSLIFPHAGHSACLPLSWVLPDPPGGRFDPEIVEVMGRSTLAFSVAAATDQAYVRRPFSFCRRVRNQTALFPALIFLWPCVGRCCGRVQSRRASPPVNTHACPPRGLGPCLTTLSPFPFLFFHRPPRP